MYDCIFIFVTVCCSSETATQVPKPAPKPWWPYSAGKERCSLTCRSGNSDSSPWCRTSWPRPWGWCRRASWFATWWRRSAGESLRRGWGRSPAASPRRGTRRRGASGLAPELGLGAPNASIRRCRSVCGGPRWRGFPALSLWPVLLPSILAQTGGRGGAHPSCTGPAGLAARSRSRGSETGWKTGPSAETHPGEERVERAEVRRSLHQTVEGEMPEDTQKSPGSHSPVYPTMVNGKKQFFHCFPTVYFCTSVLRILWVELKGGMKTKDQERQELVKKKKNRKTKEMRGKRDSKGNSFSALRAEISQ